MRRQATKQAPPQPVRETNKPEFAQGLDLSVDLAPNNPHHLRLANPVMIASGTFGYDGYGRGITEDMDLGQLGAVVPKTVTRLPREGNPEPRWYPESYREAWDAGDLLFLNAIGLTNPGIEAALRDVTPGWAQWKATVLLSFASDSVEQFGEMAAMANQATGFQGIELNLSCPNVADGSLFGHSANLTGQAVAAVRANTGLPVLAKLAPNVPNIMEIAHAAVDAGADALTICNTIPAMRIDTESRPHRRPRRRLPRHAVQSGRRHQPARHPPMAAPRLHHHRHLARRLPSPNPRRRRRPGHVPDSLIPVHHALAALHWRILLNRRRPVGHV